LLDRETARLESLLKGGQTSWRGKLLQSKLALLTIAIVVLIFQVRGLPEKLANSSLDAAIAVQRQTPSQSVRLLVIDDRDYGYLFKAQTPLNPVPLSALLTAVALGSPRAIVVDLDTSDP